MIHVDYIEKTHILFEESGSFGRGGGAGGASYVWRSKEVHLIFKLAFGHREDISQI